MDGEIDVVHHRAFFDLGLPITSRKAHDAQYLLDHQLEIGTEAFITQDADVFQLPVTPSGTIGGLPPP